MKSRVEKRIILRKTRSLAPRLGDDLAVSDRQLWRIIKKNVKLYRSSPKTEMTDEQFTKTIVGSINEGSIKLR